MKRLLITTLAILTTAGFGYGIVHAFSPQYGIAGGLIAHWSFDTRHTPWTSATTGTTIDMSGNGYNGSISLTKATAAVNGKVQQGLKFAGGTNVITIGSDFIGTNELTIAAWIYPVSFGGNNFGRIIDNSKTQLLVDNSSSQQYLTFTNNNGSTVVHSASNSVVLNRWSFVVVTRNSSGQATFYINGIVSGVANQNAGAMSIGSTVCIGNRGDLIRGFVGTIDDLRVYSRVLPQNEIQQLYRMGLAGNGR